MDTKIQHSSRAEALVRHVTQLPSFHTWAATASAVFAPASPTSPASVAQYLEARVTEVAAQLASLQHAGDYTRLVVLLAELLRGEMAAGVTPMMIEGGMLELLRAAATAVAHGEVSRYRVAASTNTREQNSASFQTGSTAASMRIMFRPAVANTTGTAASVFATPIESLLPPLIDQTGRKVKVLSDSVTNSVAAQEEQCAEDAEMEAWENYMATVRVATSANTAAPYTQKPNMPAPTLTPSPAAAPKPQSTLTKGRYVIDSLPAALCGLITSCTSAPFVVLVLHGQQLEKQAVTDLAHVLLDIIKSMSPHAAAEEVSEVRLTAIKGLYQLLTLYVTKSGASSSGATAAASPMQSCAARPARSMQAKRDKEAATTATSPPMVLDGAKLSQLLNGVTLEWVQFLATLTETERVPLTAGGNGRVTVEMNVDNGDDDFPEQPPVTQRPTSVTRGGPADELYWMLEIVHQLLHAEQLVLQHSNNIRSRNHRRKDHAMPPPIPRLLPPILIPVILRTLSILPTTPSLASRAPMCARLCIDVLWTASLIAPVSASRQLLYGALPDLKRMRSDTPNEEASATTTPVSAHEPVDAPAVDFFLALLHQFNETHSLAHREMRDDLVTLLALLLRYDVQFAEEELTARRAAAVALTPQSPTAGSLEKSDPDPEHVGEAAASLGACTPLSLTVSTVEAINAVVALMFETTCGTELSAGSSTTNTNGFSSRGTGPCRAPQADAEEKARPSALLSEDAVRSYALRFQSVSISAARRREVVDFKKYGWQLLEVHFGWQLAHLTYREYVNFHDRTAASSSVPPSAVGAGGAKDCTHPGHQYHYSQRFASTHHLAEEEVRNEAVTAALWGVQLCRLGFFDVLLLYVDTDSTVPAVVAWTREELMILEEEAWELFTSMILFTQHLDAVTGGIRVRRHRRYGFPLVVSQQGEIESHLDNRHNIKSSSNALSSASLDLDEGGFDDDDETGGALYGADMHFIAAGGVEVALRFLGTAPPEVEPVKRSALMTLAAIARTSSSGEAHLHSGNYTTKELALVHRALTEHASTLVPLLVRIIREVDTHVDAAGTPAAGTTLISSAVTATVTAANRSYDHGSTDGEVNGNMPIEAIDVSLKPAHTAASWGWLPVSASLTVVLSWCLLRCIGDVVLTEVGMMRELPDITTDGAPDDESADSTKGNNEHEADAHKTSSVDSCSRSVSTPPPSGKRVTATGVLFREDGAVERHPYEAIEIAMGNSLSSSGSSMGPPPKGEEEDETEQRNGESKNGAITTAAITASVLHPPDVIAGSNSIIMNATHNTNVAVASEAAHRRTLLRSIHEEVLLIPEFFAKEGGIDLLTTWIRHTLSLCVPVPGEGSALLPSSHYSYHQQQQRVQYGKRATLIRLPAEEAANLDRSSDIFLLLLDVFRAIVLGSEGNEEEFVRSGGVHALLDLIEAFALAHGLIERAAHHARLLATEAKAAVYADTDFMTTTTATTATAVTLPKEKKGVLLYAITLLSDLLDNCPCALDELATWHSRHIFVSPLTPGVQEYWSADKGVEAVQLLLCLWAADLPAHNNYSNNSKILASTNAGLELLRLHLRPALRLALKEEYVCRVLRRRAKIGVLKAETIRCYYRYIHAEDVATAIGKQKGEGGSDEVATDAVVLAYMERLMSRYSKSNTIASEQRIALLVNETLGLCLKVYGCLAAVGFDSLRAAETETASSPSLHVHLSSLERSFLVQIAALPALCVDEISTAMAEVALETSADAANSDKDKDRDDVAAWRPTTPDRRTLAATAAEAATRASELNQIIEVGMQVQQARDTQLYHRYIVTQLRQPVAPPADGRPGAVRGAWKTQRRLSATLGGTPATRTATVMNGTFNEQPGDYAVELAARLSARLAAEEQQHQRRIASMVLQEATARGLRGLLEEDGERDAGAQLMNTAPPTLGSSRTPYASLMDCAHATAAERQPASSFCVASPPRRSAPPLTMRVQKRQKMIARSVRKFPSDATTMKNGRKP